MTKGYKKKTRIDHVKLKQVFSASHEKSFVAFFLDYWNVNKNYLTMNKFVKSIFMIRNIQYYLLI